MTREQCIALSRWNSATTFWNDKNTDGNMRCACRDLAICVEMCIKHISTTSGIIPASSQHDIRELLKSLPNSCRGTVWWGTIANYTYLLTHWNIEDICSLDFTINEKDFKEIYDAVEQMVYTVSKSNMHNSILESRISQILTNAGVTFDIQTIINRLPGNYVNSYVETPELRAAVLTVVHLAGRQ